MPVSNDFDNSAAVERCKKYRTAIIKMAKSVSALHIGGAFSSTEAVDCIYNNLMRFGSNNCVVGDDAPDTFLMSKGHGYMIQLIILNSLGVISQEILDGYCTPKGLIGVHPDYGIPGIEASTGSLGHGLSMAVGMALANRSQNNNGIIYTVLSDGELQEGSTWEAVLTASSQHLSNLVTMVDNNNMQSLGFTHETHPSFYPVLEKFTSFGWDASEVNGHDSYEIYNAVKNRDVTKPFLLNLKTTKGKGVSYMENVPMWHYRSPNDAEYKLALEEINGVD